MQSFILFLPNISTPTKAYLNCTFTLLHAVYAPSFQTCPLDKFCSFANIRTPKASVTQVTSPPAVGHSPLEDIILELHSSTTTKLENSSCSGNFALRVPLWKVRVSALARAVLSKETKYPYLCKSESPVGAFIFCCEHNTLTKNLCWLFDLGFCGCIF